MSKSMVEHKIYALQMCKKYLWDGVSCREHNKYFYICYALTHTIRSDNTKRIAVTELRDTIARRLDGYATMWDWLRNAIGVPYDQLTAQRMQEHRFRWIDLMIKELEAQL